MPISEHDDESLSVMIFYQYISPGSTRYLVNMFNIYYFVQSKKYLYFGSLHTYLITNNITISDWYGDPMKKGIQLWTLKCRQVKRVKIVFV